MKTLLFTLFCSAMTLQGAITINYGNPGSGDVVLRDFNGEVLRGISKDGAVSAIVQLGYYSLSTTADPFAGEWVALTGEGTACPLRQSDRALMGQWKKAVFWGRSPGKVCIPAGFPFLPSRHSFRSAFTMVRVLPNQPTTTPQRCRVGNGPTAEPWD